MKKILLLFLLALSPLLMAEEDRSRYNELFEKAGKEFSVPPDVLRGISFAETRWSHLQWAEGDTASPENGMPRPYGIMSLWDNAVFGHSLREAAALLGLPAQTLKDDPYQNIRGAAALLRSHYDRLPKPNGTSPSDLESWTHAIAAYCGIKQPDLAYKHALDIYEQIAAGYHHFGIEMDARPVEKLDLVRSVCTSESERQTRLHKPTAQPDYPSALWSDSYPGHWYTTGFGRYGVVIHDMEGYYLSTISYFKDSSTQASVHYCINSGYLSNGRPAGEVTQMIEEKYWAWHVRCWNKYFLGIEHEGFESTAAWYTDAMYQSSANLVKYLCNKYGIPKDRDHIIGHQEWQNPNWVSWVNTSFNPSTDNTLDPTCNTHTDPGPNWKWDYYMNLIRGDSSLIGFEDVALKFYSGPMISGSTLGVSKLSSFSQTGTLPYRGTYAGKLVLIDSSESQAWFVRQYFTGSVNKAPVGFVHVALKTSSIPSGLQLRLAFDDNNNTATEISSWKNITADGQWHLYEWNMQDTNQWYGWVGACNGKLDGPMINFDSFQFQCNDPNSGATAYEIDLDDLAMSATAALPVEMTPLRILGSGNTITLFWETVTEIDNHGFEVERSFNGGLWQSIGFVPGAGSSNVLHSYTYMDAVAGGTYLYRIAQIDLNGNRTFSNEVSLSVGMSPEGYGLAQNYPNPFNPTTMVRFSLATAQKATLKIYNAAGQEVAPLFDGIADAGRYYDMPFNASGLASGMYFSVLQTASNREVKKMTLLK